jgi:hypothetical protein
MYTPTPGDVHVNTPLTQISIAYLQSQDQFVAAQVCPVIPVTKQSDRYYVYNRGDFFRDQMQRRAPGTPAASVGYRLDNTPTYFADVWGEAKPIPDQLRGNADAVLNMDRDAVEFLSQQALIRREKIFAANLFTTGKWNTDMAGVVAAYRPDFVHVPGLAHNGFDNDPPRDLQLPCCGRIDRRRLLGSGPFSLGFTDFQTGIRSGNRL